MTSLADNLVVSHLIHKKKSNQRPASRFPIPKLMRPGNLGWGCEVQSRGAPAGRVLVFAPA